MQRFSIFHVLLCFGLVAGQEPCTVGSKRSAKTSKYSDVLRSLYFLLRMHTASISCLSSPEYKSRVARLTLTPKQDFRQKKCDFIRREMEGGHKARQEVTTLIGHIA